MAGPKRPAGDELAARITAWGDAIRAAAGCTEPANRPAAESAIASLYTAAGRPVPAFAWAPSPAAGLLAYHVASLTRGGIRSRWICGDVGTGWNRELNALAEPFGMETAWVLRLAESVRTRIPSSRPGQAPRPIPAHPDPVVAASEALGFAGTSWLLALVQTAAAAGAANVAVPRGDARPEAVDVAAGVLGDAWPRLVAILGPELAREAYATAVQQLVVSILGASGGRRQALVAMQPGQWDVRTPVLAAARDVLGGTVWRHRAGRAEHEAQIDARLEIARSAGPWWALADLAIVAERPVVVRRDDRGRPHCADGPSVAWSDGLEAFAWHSVAVEPWVILDPGRITVAMIDREENAELRRILVERFGEERLIREGGAELVGEDETGRLWRRRVGEPRPPWVRTAEPIVMVEVVNSTPEHDGSRRTYFLRVPPTVQTPREAVAWTFGLGAIDYRPAVES